MAHKMSEPSARGALLTSGQNEGRTQRTEALQEEPGQVPPAPGKPGDGVGGRLAAHGDPQFSCPL